MRQTNLSGLASLVVVHEAADCADNQCLMAAVGSTFEKLRSLLIKMIGKHGYQSLFLRALSLAEQGYPKVDHFTINEDGSLNGVNAMIDHQHPIYHDRERWKESYGYSLAILARLFEVLEGLIGEEIMFRLLQRVWPELEFVARTSSENLEP